MKQKLGASTIIVLASAVSAFAQSNYDKCTGEGWISKPDAAFASDCVEMAFSGSLDDRQQLAWMFFGRVNQLIKAGPTGGISGTDMVPLWMAWPTDTDTFAPNSDFKFGDVPRSTMAPSVEKKDLNAGKIALADPDSANEEVTRNEIGYDYLISSGLTSKDGVETFFKGNEFVDMPIGSVELKASWLQVTQGSPAPDGAMTFAFEGGEYWFRGLHIMVKMQRLDDPNDVFYTSQPSWFWTTFEFNNNSGIENVRANLLNSRAPLSQEMRTDILETAGLSDTNFGNYASNGTQIRFTKDDGSPVILGHTNMEDFAGLPNTAQPAYWTSFQASCHSCHASASYNPDTKSYFPFSVPVGDLHPGYNKTPTGAEAPAYLGQGYKSLDFMWPIAFRAR